MYKITFSSLKVACTGHASVLFPQWLHNSPQNNIMVLREAILSAENSGKPLDGRGSARTLLGAHSNSPDRLKLLPQEPHRRSGPSA